MAYRFLLEAPESLASEASVAVDGTPDAQVVLVRNSHGLGFEDEYVNLTVAAHSLRVIDRLYDWFDALGASRSDIRLVLHSGDRLSLEGVDRGSMVAAIRRDQPWVERSAPRIGDHVEPFNPETERQNAEVVAIDATGGNAPDLLTGGAPANGAASLPELGRRVQFRAINHIAVWVNEPAKAELFYQQFLNMDVTGRARRNDVGEFETITGPYDWSEARRLNREADISYVSNGAITLALLNAGRGARLERGIVDHISVTVDPTSYDMLKGEVLVRSLTVFASSEIGFRFRDPFGLTWEISALSPVGAGAVAH